MRGSMLLKCMVTALALGSLLTPSAGRGQTPNQAYMSFMTNGPTGTTITTGDAASFMHAGTDWDGATLVAGVAAPTLMQASQITTYRDGSNLYFKFVIPDRTVKENGATLPCGDRVILQLDPAGAKALTLAATGYYRYEVVIKDLLAGSVVKRVPQSVAGHWIWSSTGQTTTASVSGFSAAGNQYSFTLTIPLADAGNPVSSFGLALAIINDLGHSHGSPAVNEATGTAFPSGMGLTPESEPGITCGATVPATESATGNWVAPVTWGTAYASTIAGTVTLSQLPSFYISNSIKLGLCQVVQWGDIADIPSTTNWEAIQQSAGSNWYLYNPGGPCRMTVWINPQVTGAGMAQRRFLVVWGRPGISPQDWYFAGLTNPVAVTGTNTYVSFVWNNPPSVSFTSHPCLRVYVLPATLTPAQITTLQGITTQAQLSAMESTYGVPQGSTYSAQMNFNNIGTGSCTNSACMPLTFEGEPPNPPRWANFALARHVLEAGILPSWLQQKIKPDGQGEPGGRPRPGVAQKRVRVFARGFGVADPAAGKNYVYVESLGGIGWAVPVGQADETLSLDFSVANPKITERALARGKLIDVPSPPRRILVAYTTTVPNGVKAPTIDQKGTQTLGNTPVAPGAQDSVHVTVTQAGVGGGPAGGIPWWLWLLILLIVIVVAAVAYFRKHATP